MTQQSPNEQSPINGMTKSNQKKKEDNLPEILNLFLDSLSDVIKKKVTNVNPNIFRTFDETRNDNNLGGSSSFSNPNRPKGFV